MYERWTREGHGQRQLGGLTPLFANSLWQPAHRSFWTGKGNDSDKGMALDRNLNSGPSDEGSQYESKQGLRERASKTGRARTYDCHPDCTIPVTFSVGKRAVIKIQTRFHFWHGKKKEPTETHSMVRRSQSSHLVTVPSVLKEKEFHLLRNLGSFRENYRTNKANSISSREKSWVSHCVRETYLFWRQSVSPFMNQFSEHTIRTTLADFSQSTKDW